MSMTELERHLLNSLEELQQEFRLSQESQDKRLADLEVHQGKQEQIMNQLPELFKKLELLLQRLNNILQKQ